MPYLIWHGIFVVGRYTDICSCCQGQCWHEPRTRMHGWLVFNLYQISAISVTSLILCNPVFYCSYNIGSFLLTCNFYFLASGKAAEFGPLKDGYMFESSTGLSRM